MTAWQDWFLGAVLAATLAVAPASAQNQQSVAPDARIVVTGEGSVSVAPDYAQIGAGVVTRAKTAGEAADANAKAMTAVIAALADAGIARNDIQTAQFSVQPIYAAPQPGSEQKLTGFAVSNRVSVKVRDLGKTGAILDRLLTAGANDLGSIEYLHADPSQVLDRAREAAVADARRKAELYAKAAGLTLGNVAFISEDIGVTPPVFGKMLRAAPMQAAPTPIMSGEDTLRVQITVGFDVAH